jgi:outer membrane protein OmpA-like peptidoglycan-associated protein
LLLVEAGCASKSYVVLLQSPDGSTGAILVDTGKGATLVNIKQQGMALDGSSAKPFDVDQQRIDADFSQALAAQPQLPVSFLLYFKLGGSELTPDSSSFLKGTVLKTIRERGACAVSVIGHTDTMGLPDWNQQIGLLRAKAIAAILKTNNLQTLELSVTSHGESNLLIKTADETPEPRNRRVEINIR